MSKNPYLKTNRLPDVIAAITSLGTYKFYKLTFSAWSKRISGTSWDEKYWAEVFRDHPEFFRINSGEDKVSLVWRRQFPRNYNVDIIEENVPDDEIDGTSEDRISRKPLNESEVTSLIGVAIDLHKQALDHEKAKRWWIPILSAVLAFVGSLIGSLLPRLM